MNRKSLSKKIQVYAARLLLPPLIAVACRLDWKRAAKLGLFLGDIAYFLSRRYRRQAIENLTAAYGDQWSAADIRRVARRVFRHFATAGIEFFAVQRLNEQEVREKIALRGKENLDAALSKGCGAVIVTGHLGNWELLARRLVIEGYKLNVIARDSDDPTMTGVFNSVRETGGYVVLPRDRAAAPALRCLRKNEVLGVLPDQNTLGPCEFPDFFGRPAATATGPAVFSTRTGAPIVMAFAPRLADGTYEAVIHPPIVLESTGDRESDVRVLVQAYTSAIEAEIRKYPDQWLWLHGRWRRRPRA